MKTNVKVVMGQCKISIHSAVYRSKGTVSKITLLIYYLTDMD